jgi:DNA primase
VWVCHSDSCVAVRGGRVGGNVLDFVAAMENCSIREAALKLQEWFTMFSPCAPSLTPAHQLRKQPGRTGPATPTPADAGRNKPLAFILKGIDFSHRYLAERGISGETARHFGVGFFPGRGLMAGRVVIPIHDEDGHLIAYAGRALGPDGAKYKLPPGFRKSLILFNLHRAAQHGNSVIVVEGFFDCLNVHQAGLPCVVALMGSSLSRRQEQLLQEHFREVALLLDGDKAGRAAGVAIAERLVCKLSTRVIEIPTDKQPDQLGADQIRCLCIPGYF